MPPSQPGRVGRRPPRRRPSLSGCVLIGGCRNADLWCRRRSWQRRWGHLASRFAAGLSPRRRRLRVERCDLAAVRWCRNLRQAAGPEIAAPRDDAVTDSDRAKLSLRVIGDARDLERVLVTPADIEGLRSVAGQEHVIPAAPHQSREVLVEWDPNGFARENGLAEILEVA